MLNTIKYNIKFRNAVPDDLMEVLQKNGFITGSFLISSKYDDVDLVVYCNLEILQFLGHVDAEDKVNDAAQIIFETLFCRGYTIYINDNYRDSTFLSCYIHHNQITYNLLLMDEVNVVAEWKYATSQLILNSNDSSLLSKYDRIRFFEKKRKEFRRKLVLPS